MHASDIAIDGLNPTFLFAIKYDRERSGYPHSHDYIEILYLYSGEGRYEIDGVTYDVAAGNLLIINPGVTHANIVTNPDNPLTILALGLCDVKFMDMAPNTITFETQTPVLQAGSELQNHIISIFFRILAEKEQQCLGKYDMMRLYLGQILLHIIREYKNPAQTLVSKPSFTSHRKNHVVQTIMDYMEGHYAEKISLDGIASNMYLSPIYISKIFKEKTGESPIQYLIKIRLRNAVRLMKEHPDYSIRQIAQEVGYDDAYHFSKIFKKHMAATPKDYRRQHFPYSDK